MRTAVRTIGAALLAPMALAFVAALPVLGKAAFVQWFLISTAICTPLFLVCAAICHLILRWKQWAGWREYVGVMFAVGTLVLLFARLVFYQMIFGNGGSEFHLGTQVIEGGRFSSLGVVVLTGESMFGALWLALAFGLFWRMTMRGRAPHDA